MLAGIDDPVFFRMPRSALMGLQEKSMTDLWRCIYFLSCRTIHFLCQFLHFPHNLQALLADCSWGFLKDNTAFAVISTASKKGAPNRARKVG
jgi:hypothetical protein